MIAGKRILYLITKANWGGAQKYVYELARAAKQAGCNVTVAYGEAGELADRLRAEDIHTIEVAALGRDVNLARDFAATGALREIFKRERPDTVHLNSSKAGLAGALAARSAGIPQIIFTAHGWPFNESRPFLQKLIFRTLCGAIVFLSTETICVSQAVARDIAWLPFSRSKLVVIHNGIECGALFAREEARALIASDKKEALWIGMISELHPTKRIEDAIAAFAKIASAHPEALLIIIGEGGERTRLEALTREKNLTGRVILRGFLRDAARYLPAFDIFLHASQSEALAYAILEAGCASLPVVAANVGGIPEIIEDRVSGILVPARDIHAIAHALEELIGDPRNRAAMGHALHSRILTEFSQSKMLTETLAQYQA